MPYKDKETRNAKARERYANDPVAHERMLETSKAHNAAKRRAQGAREYTKRGTMGLPSYKSDPNAYHREYWTMRRHEAVVALGGKCQCGVDDERVLQIDHVNGDGRVDRKANHQYDILRRIASGLTEGYQLLCSNCHVIKTREAGEHKMR